MQLNNMLTNLLNVAMNPLTISLSLPYVSQRVNGMMGNQLMGQ